MIYYIVDINYPREYIEVEIINNLYNYMEVKFMKVQFLGTAAAEGIPALFCNCPICMESKKLGGKNIRKRSSIIIDDKIVIDFTNDVMHHVHTYGIDYSRLEYLLITHSHSDHFNYYDLEFKLPGYRNEGNPKLNIYANQTCLDILDQFEDFSGDINEHFTLNRAEPFKTFFIEDYKITPLTAKHSTMYKEEECLIYIIEHEGKRMLYGLDSGYYFDNVIEHITNLYFDLAILDCTCGFGETNENSTHMCLKDNERIVHILKENNALDEKSTVISQHFSHNGLVVYDRDKDTFKNKGLIMAYDGMKIEV